MKRICILLLALSLGFLTLSQPTFATTISQPAFDGTLNPGQSLWVQLNPVPAPTGFDGMTLFWGLELWDATVAADMDYRIYGPTGYTGGSTTYDPLQAPSIVDLSIFEGKDVVFEFYNKPNSQIITFKTPVAVNDGEIGGDEETKPPYTFYYAFYDNATSGWETRDVNKYIAGSWSYVRPADLGYEFFFHDLSGTVDGQVPATMNIRSDFQAVPEPATLLLLASGIAVLAGGRRKFRKK